MGERRSCGCRLWVFLPPNGRESLGRFDPIVCTFIGSFGGNAALLLLR
jgi:hypothetical protein